MATFKALPLLLLALIAFSMLATVALANNPYGPGSLTINRSAFVFHQASMATSKFALATTTGRPNRVAPNALNFFYKTAYSLRPKLNRYM
uniref:Uncharacterized protein n=1 Tax=Chenopodium quinoa TaxID=63459 RepID=A0A803M146_CHEQI